MNILNGKIDRTKQDVNVRLCNGKNREEEVDYIITNAEEAMNIGESVVIILPTHEEVLYFINTVLRIKNKENWNKEVDRYNKTNYHSLNSYLNSNNIDIKYLGNRFGNLINDKMIVMTYHSAKGLDFDNVFLPFLSESSGIRNEILLMVGMTRSKKDLCLTYSGREHRFIEAIKDKCIRINIEDSKENNRDELEF